MKHLFLVLVICSGSLSSSSGNAALFAVDFDTIYSKLADITVADSVSFRLLQVNPISLLDVTRDALIFGPVIVVVGGLAVSTGVRLYLHGDKEIAAYFFGNNNVWSWLIGACLSPYRFSGVLLMAGGTFCLVLGVIKTVKGIELRRGRPAQEPAQE